MGPNVRQTAMIDRNASPSRSFQAASTATKATSAATAIGSRHELRARSATPPASRTCAQMTQTKIRVARARMEPSEKELCKRNLTSKTSNPAREVYRSNVPRAGRGDCKLSAACGRRVRSGRAVRAWNRNGRRRRGFVRRGVGARGHRRLRGCDHIHPAENLPPDRRTDDYVRRVRELDGERAVVEALPLRRIQRVEKAPRVLQEIAGRGRAFGRAPGAHERRCYLAVHQDRDARDQRKVAGRRRFTVR